LTITNAASEHEIYSPYSDETDVSFLLRAKVTPGTLLFRSEVNPYTYYPIFQTIHEYEAEDVVQHSGKFYSAKIGFTSGAAFLLTDWDLKTAEEVRYSEARDSISGVISGNLVTAGVVNYSTLRVNISLERPTGYPITVQFRSVNPCVLELDWSNEYFLDLFSARFLTAFGTTKAIMRVDELPVDITVDSLVDYGKDREQKIQDRGEWSKKWWQW
jgi:hypothetical protein